MAKSDEREHKATRTERAEGTRSLDGCLDAANEISSGGCRVLGHFFQDLSEAFDSSRRRETGERRGPCSVKVASDVCASVGRGVSEAAQTVERASDKFVENLESSDEAAPKATTTEPKPKA